MYLEPSHTREAIGLNAKELEGRAEEGLAAVEPGGAFVLETDRDPSPVCMRWLATRPTAFSWSPLAWGPDRWRVEIGRRAEADGGPRLDEALTYDHERISALMTKLGESGRDGAADLRRSLVAFELGWLRHTAIEEDLLYPAFRYAAGFKYGPLIDVFLEQHKGLNATLEKIRQTVASGDGDAGESAAKEVAYLVGHFRSAYDSHSDKEEASVYPIGDELLDAGKRRHILDALRLWTPAQVSGTDR